MPAAVPVCLVFLLSACDLGAVALGDDDVDQRLLSESPAALHLVDALEGGGELTFAQLFERGEGLTFANRPDPSALLTATNVLDDARDRAGRVPLTLLTLNIGLLDLKVLGFIPYARTPDLDQRRQVVAGRIFSRADDVVLLQELWLEPDIEEFVRTGEDFGYRGFFPHDRSTHVDGLAIFVKESVISGGTTPSVRGGTYASQDTKEYFPGPGIQRSWMSLRFIHPDVGPVTLFDTHLQSFPEHWLGRMKQGRELGIIMRQVLDDEETADDLILLGGDLNAAPYYTKATWTIPDGSVQDRWFHNTLLQPVLASYADLVDLAIMGRPARDALADVALGDTVVNDATTALDIPGASPDWCATTPTTTFTNTDCNSLSFEQYAGTEYPARVDHLLAHDPNGRIVVAKSELVFTKPEPFGGVVVETSDHYGVAAEIFVSR